MAQCVNCGREGDSLEVSEDGLCLRCVEAMRRVASQAYQVLNMARLMVEATKQVLTAFRNGVCDKAVMDQVAELSDAAIEAAHRAIEAIESTDVRRAEATTQASRREVEDLIDRAQRLINQANHPQ